MFRLVKECKKKEVSQKAYLFLFIRTYKLMIVMLDNSKKSLQLIAKS